MPTALDSSLPFDGPSYTESDWVDMFGPSFRSGVIMDYANEFEPFADSTGRQSKVQSGRARVNGIWGESTSTKTLAHSTNVSGQPRIDLVVLRVDYTANQMELDVLTGTPGASPSPPALTQSASVYEVPLAEVGPLASGYSTIAAGDVTDLRLLLSPYAAPHYRTGEARDAWQPDPRGGMLAWRADTEALTVSDGTDWFSVARIPTGRCRVYRSGDQSIPDDTATAIIFDETSFDEDGMHDAGGLNTRITIQQAGTYLVGGGARLDSTAFAAHNRYLLRIRENGTDYRGAQSSNAESSDAGPRDLSVCDLLELAAGDYLELVAYQDSGGAVDILDDGTSTPHFWVTRQD